MLKTYDQWNTPPQQIIIPPRDIHVWRINVNDYSNYLANFYKLLSYDEHKRTSQYHFEKDRKNFIIARGILRSIISRYLLITPEEIKFSYNAYGKPYLNPKNNGPLYFNISHSADLILYIFSKNNEVGIDVENIHPIDNFENIAEQFFSPRENIKLKSVPASLRLNSFFKCWTRKEAFIKAIGNGLSYPLHEFDVSLLPNEPATLLKVQRDPYLSSQWSLKALTPYPGYEAAFIFKVPCENIKYWQYD